MMNTTVLNSTFESSSFALMSVLFLYSSVSLPLNCYCLFLLLSRVLDVSLVFTLNCLLAEVFISVMSLTYGLVMLYFDPLFYLLMNFIFGSTMSARIFFQCCVCVERYLAVVRPVTFLKLRPGRYRVWCSVLAWMCAQGVGVVSLFSLPGPPYNPATLVYLVLFSVELYCCASVLKGLLRPAPGERDHRNLNGAKTRAFRVICVNLSAMMVQNTPITLSLCFRDRLSEEELNMVRTAGVVTNFFTGFIQPVYILHKAGKLWTRT